MRVSGKHNDLDDVGLSPRHHTFFEMLGNFSFGDYFKREAIGFGWEFLTQVLGLDPTRLYPTVYQEDDEAFNLWQKVSGLPAERITRLGKRITFGPWAIPAPRPCSEIYGSRAESVPRPGDCNLATRTVQRNLGAFDAREDGSMVPLGHPSHRHRLGLERVTSVCGRQQQL